MRGFGDTSPKSDTLTAAALAAGTLTLYAGTLLPGLGSGDTAEFQRVLPTLGVAHPTGYPLYTILGWLWSQLPFGAPAWRVSMLSAVLAALAVAAVYLAAREMGQPRAAAAAAALALAASRTFWSQATIAEVYALAALVQALLLLALLRWRAGRWSLWAAGLLAGLGLAHHRTIVLMIPGALLFVLLSYGRPRARREVERSDPPSVIPAPAMAKKDLVLALGALLAPLLLYLYLPLRAPPWLDSWRTFGEFVAGSDALSTWLTIDEPGRVLLEHLRELVARLIWPQLTPFGAALALLGAARLWRRDRQLAALLTSGYLLVLLFCALFFVQDVEVFLISGHLIAALLLGEGLMFLLGVAARLRHGDKETKRQGDIVASRPFVSLSPGLLVARWAIHLMFFALPAFLLLSNLPAIRAANTRLPELAARATLAQPLAEHALLLIDWEAVEPLRYLQEIEGIRRDVEIRPLNADAVARDVDAALRAGRATYLLHAQPSLGLAQAPEGRLWRVGQRPLELSAATSADTGWRDGIELRGFTLPRGPYRPGEIVPVTLAWRAEATPRASYTLFVHVVGPGGVLWGQQDRPPAPYTTDRWPAGRDLLDLYGPTLRLDTPPGRYTVVIGWYAYPSLERLPLAAGDADSFTLGEIDVEPLR